MRPIIVGVEVDDTLDKITLLKELLYPVNGFFQLTSVKDDLNFKNIRWLGLSLPWNEQEIILMAGKERFLNKSYTEVASDCYLEFKQVADFLASVDLTVTLDGEPLPNVSDHWRQIVDAGDRDQDGDADFESRWRYRVGILSPGTHWVETRATLEWPVTDGFDSDGDGLPDEYSGQVWQFSLRIVVEE